MRAVVCLGLMKVLSKVFAVLMPTLCSAGAIIEKDGKILLLELTYMKGYGLPGGFLESDESAEDAVDREVFEETGLKVTAKKFLWSIPEKRAGIPTLGFIFAVDVTGEERGSEEGSLIWLDPRDAMGKMAHKKTEIVLKRYLAEKK